MKKKIASIAFIFTVTLMQVSSASATVITTHLTNIIGNSWEAEYVIENDSLGSPIEEFTIWFDLGLYENISVVSTPADWDPLVIQPDPNIPDNGFYDALALSSGILSNSTLGGFTVAFDWLGGNSSKSQSFEVIDPLTFNTLETGNTVIASVPEPKSIALLALGLISLLSFRKVS